MHKILSILVYISLIMSFDKEDIIEVLENYNYDFGKSNYSEIIRYFNYPVSFNLKDKTITASNKFKLKLIYRKIIGDLPEFYAYSKWDKIDIQLIDDSIVIANAQYSRFKNDNTVYESGSAQYNLRLIDGEWKIFSLTPYNNTFKFCDED